MAKWLNLLQNWDSLGPVASGLCNGGCLNCRDCRRGLLLDISGLLPVVDTVYTRTRNGVSNDFTIKSISWAHATSYPFYLGTYAKESGAILKRCCERVIGSCMVNFTNDFYGVEEYNFSAIIIGVRQGSIDDEVYFKISHSNDANDTYLFSFIRDPSSEAGGERTLCHIPRGVYTNLGQILPADYATGRGYLEEYEDTFLPVMPAYCNNNGGYANQGMNAAAPSPSTNEYECACNGCYGPTGYTLTVSDLSSLCVFFMQPSADSIDLEWDLEYINGDTEQPSGILCGPIRFTDDDQLTNEHSSTPIECDAGSNPDDLCFEAETMNSEFTAQASIEFNGNGIGGYPGESGKNVKVTITLTFTCGDPDNGIIYVGTGEAYFTWVCAGGIQSDSESVDIDFYSGATGPISGTITLAIAPT